MKRLVQARFAEPEDPGLDEPIVLHQRGDPSENDALIVFVHGMGGTRYGPKSTWGYFPRFIFEDLPSLDVGMYRYRTLFQRLRLTRSVELEVEALVFSDILRDLTSYARVVLVGHSMGGLLCKATIWRLLQANQMGVLLRIRGLILMATPQLGSLRLPRLFWNLTNDARALRPHSTLVENINKAFVNRVNHVLGQDQPEKVPIPTFAVLAVADHWVDRLSAGENLPDEQQKRVTGSHTTIVKPTNKDKDEYRWVRSKIEVCLKRAAVPAPLSVLPASKPRASGLPYRVIAFDLDGTLIRGIEFSWTLVWDYLKFPESVRKAGMLRYRRREFTYTQWCEWACAQFRSRGLKRQDFPKIVAGLTITKNLREALTILRNDGFVTAIISGGIDVFLQELIPGAKDWFNPIYLNRLKFDADGLISGVDATPYDFEGKAAALEKICYDHGYALSQSVFVGEGFNDEYVAGQAGLSIAYPPTSQGFRSTAIVEIEEDDLMKVVEYVLTQV